MLNRNFTNLLAILTLTLLASSNVLTAEEKAKTPAPLAAEALAQDSKPIRDPVAQLRGKLLYKRSQARKLERKACENDPALAEKISRLEAEIETLYSSAEPKLNEIYAEQKQLSRQIETLSKKE